MKITGTCALSKLSTKRGEIRMIFRDKLKLIREHQDENREDVGSRDRDK